MVSSCCVKGCSEKFVKGGGVSYFRISSKPEMQRNAWILALKRNGWIPKPHHRICSRHFVTGTWNADPNHIDYIPTRGMNKDLGLFDCSANNDSLDVSGMDYSLCDSPANGIEGALALLNDGASSLGLPHTSISNSFSNEQSHIANARVPIMGVSTSQFSGTSTTPTSSSTHGHRPKKMSRKDFHKWSSSPKLTSSHFCEHQDSHRNCCRVIRELAEENQILKSQVSCLFYEMQKLRSQCDAKPQTVTEDSRSALKLQTQLNGGNAVFSNGLADIEAVSESPPSLNIDEELGLSIDEFPEDDEL